MWWSAESPQSGMARAPGPNRQPLASAPRETYRMRRAAGIVFVFVALVLVALVTFGVVTQTSGVGLALLYPLVALFLVPFFWLASRQRAAIYPEGFVPPDRRPREFLAGGERFEPFTEVERDRLDTFIDGIASNRYSWTWKVEDPELFRRAAADVRRWAEQRYGALHLVPPEAYESVWRAYDAPA